MANICKTDYAIIGKRENIERIKNAVENHPTLEGSDESWQGNILHALGMSEEEIDKYDVSGFLSNCNDIEGDGDNVCLRIGCEEKWSRTDFAEVLQKLFPDIKVYWIAEELGNSIFETNDADGEFFTDRVVVEGDWSTEYFESIEDAYAWLGKVIGCNNQTELDNYNQTHENDFINVVECEVV
jgi:hypothetical protein